MQRARLTGRSWTQTWPRHELAVDVLHETIYGFATGLVADTLAARNGPAPGQPHSAKRPGRRGDVGPRRVASVSDRRAVCAPDPGPSSGPGPAVPTDS